MVDEFNWEENNSLITNWAVVRTGSQETQPTVWSGSMFGQKMEVRLSCCLTSTRLPAQD